jgi:hypothetical protein
MLLTPNTVLYIRAYSSPRPSVNTEQEREDVDLEIDATSNILLKDIFSCTEALSPNTVTTLSVEPVQLPTYLNSIFLRTKHSLLCQSHYRYY